MPKPKPTDNEQTPAAEHEPTPTDLTNTLVTEMRNAISEYDLSHYPNLKGHAKAEDVLKIDGRGGFNPSYINWARTMQILREHAPGWLPDMERTPDGSPVWNAPGIGAFIMMRFVHADGRVTPSVPQAIMDNKNNSVPFEGIDARDVTDTHRRGLCMAAALTFGLAYELWAKLELESGYADNAHKVEQEGGKSVASWCRSIDEAATMTELKRVFALAWNEYRGNDAAHEKLQSAYEGRKIDLSDEVSE